MSESKKQKSKWLSDHKVKKLKEFASDNKGETAAFALLIIGLLISFANPLWGSAIVGLVTGFYFYEPILEWLTHIGASLNRLGSLKAAILLVIFILFFMAYPLFFIATSIVVAIMQLIQIVGKKS